MVKTPIISGRQAGRHHEVSHSQAVPVGIWESQSSQVLKHALETYLLLRFHHVKNFTWAITSLAVLVLLMLTNAAWELCGPRNVVFPILLCLLQLLLFFSARVIAMSFPSSGQQAFYRNPIKVTQTWIYWANSTWCFSGSSFCFFSLLCAPHKSLANG